MEFETLSVNQKEMLLKALDMNINHLKCEYCSKRILLKDCSIMPPLTKENPKTIIICGGSSCLSEYFNNLK